MQSSTTCLSPSSVWEFCRTESLLTQQRERSICETSTQSQLLDESVYSKSFLFNPETLHWRIDTNVGALALVSSATCLSVSFLSSEFGGRGWYSLLTSVIETYYFLFPVVKNPALCRNHWKMTGWKDKGEVSVALATRVIFRILVLSMIDESVEIVVSGRCADETVGQSNHNGMHWFDL